VILMNNFRAEPPALRAAMLDAVRRVLDSGSYVLGREVEAFESEWAATCGARHAIGVGNGLDAIEIALRGRGHRPGRTRFSLPP
jgi:dTDP-4-amino-4,6-dideoxygalactose transaminase